MRRSLCLLLLCLTATAAPAQDALPAGAVKRYGDLRFHTGVPIRGIALSPAANLVACHTDHEVLVWTVPEGKLLFRKKGELPREGAFCADGKKLLIVDKMNVDEFRKGPVFQRARVVDSASGKELLPIRPEEEDMTALAWVGKDGKLAVGLADGSVELLDAAGKSVGRLKSDVFTEDAVIVGQAEWPYRIAVSPDGKTAAVQYGASRSRVGIWDLAAGKLRGLSTSRFDVPCLGLAIADDNRTLRVSFIGETKQHRLEKFDIGPGKDPAQVLQFAARHTGWTVSQRGAFSADGNLYAQVDVTVDGNPRLHRDGTVRVHNLAESKGQNLDAFFTELVHVAFSGDGSMLATGGEDCAIRFWNTRTGAETHVREGANIALASLAVSRDERQLAIATDDGKAFVLDIVNGSSVQKLPAVKGFHASLLFLPDGKTLVSLERSDDRFARGTLHFWDWKTAAKTSTIALLSGGNGTLSCSKDGNFLVFATAGGTTFHVDVKDAKVFTGKRKESLYHSLKPPFGDYVKELQPGVRFYESQRDNFARTARPLPSALGYRNRGKKQDRVWQCAALSADGSSIVLAERNRLTLFDAESGRELKQLAPLSEPQHPGQPVCWYQHVLFTPDGKRVIAVQDLQPTTEFRIGTADGNQEIQVWDVAAGMRLRRFAGHLGPIRDLAFAENGRALFTAGTDGTVLLWDLDAPLPNPGAADLAAQMFDADDVAAVQAMQALAADPARAAQAYQYWLADVPANEKVAALVKDLSQSNLAQRLKAVDKLAEMRDVEPAVEIHLLRAVVRTDADENTRLCALDLLDATRGPKSIIGSAVLREYTNVTRIIKLSEWVADQPAKDRLKLFSDRLPASRGGKAARDALARIADGSHRRDLELLAPLPSGKVQVELKLLRILSGM